MERIVCYAMLVLLLSGCRITTSVVGDGTVISRSGNFNCSTGNAGDCVEDYQTAGSETFEAVPAPGWTFVKWTNCSHATLTTCSTAFGLNPNNDVWPITATFKPSDPPVQSASYTYNALGQRMTKTVGNVTTIFQYDLEGNLIAELSSSGQSLRQHIHANNEPIAQLSRNATGGLDAHYVHADHLGTPSLLTDQGGRVVADVETAPFGETYVDYAEVEYNKRFPGQYKDGETGLHYNYFRDYDPTTGRYLQSDPIGLNGGLNSYTYVVNNPLRFIDLLGLSTAYVDRSYGTVTITLTDGEVFFYPAGNKTTNPSGDPLKVGSNGPAPAGTWPVQSPVKTSGDVRFGPYFWPIGAVDAQGNRADIARQRGIGLHGGRRSHESPTYGCIRMDDEDILDLHQRTLDDPLTFIEIH